MILRGRGKFQYLLVFFSEMEYKNSIVGEHEMSLSQSAIAVLKQLAIKPVWDGDIVSKEGRDELVRIGLAKRDRRDDQGLAINELTERGENVASFGSCIASLGRGHH